MLHSIDWISACTVAAFGTVCWMAGWHTSLRHSGRMYDEGYRDGFRKGIEERESKP